MLIKEFYDKHGKYEEAMSRFSDETVIRFFLGKFLKDGSYESFSKALEMNDIEESFKAAHALKGVVGNMAFDHLYDEVSKAVEILRNGTEMPEAELCERIADMYESIVSDIGKIVECR